MDLCLRAHGVEGGDVLEEGDGGGVLIVGDDEVGGQGLLAAGAGYLEVDGAEVEGGEVAEGGDVEAEIDSCLQLVAHLIVVPDALLSL